MDKRFCIFDMDGTLVDSMQYWAALGRDYLRSKGFTPGDDFFLKLKALTMLESAAFFMEEFGLEGPPAKIVDEMQVIIAEHYHHDVPLKPGVGAYLKELRAGGVRLCVATATPEPLARICLERLEVAQYLDVIVSCETIGVGKDRPDVFLAAAQVMGAAPGDCAVFEDAYFAAVTAQNAGFYTVGVRESVCSKDWPKLQTLCDEVVEDWTALLTPAQRLYACVQDIWAGYHTHPFVTGIGDGTLDVEKFKFFLLQDYLYLFDYAKVFAIGVAKAEDPALMAGFAQSVHEILNGEMEIHRAYMARLGISAEQVQTVKKSMANASYTAYMLSAAYAGGPAEILAAILACSWSYAEIGAQLAARPGAVDHPFYGTWIAGYASEDYQTTNQGLIKLVSRLCAGYTQAQWSHIEEIFVMCSRYEAGFWDMAWKREQ